MRISLRQCYGRMNGRTNLLRAFKATKKLTLAELSSVLPRNVLTDRLMQRFTDLLDHNVPSGKLFRAQCLLDAHSCLRQSSRSGLETEKVYRLAWALEYFHSFLLIADDIMDKANTRRGKTCWYKMPDIGMSAINDAFLLENYVIELLRGDFSHQKDVYLLLLEAFQEAKMKTILGQAMDTVPKSPADCSLELYNDIVQFKTSHYSFYLPVQLALILNGAYQNTDVKMKTLELCYHVGYYFQAQDDYLDCFGTEVTTGKSTRDIQEGKCSWLLATALSRLTSSQLSILQKTYGINDEDASLQVKKLYEDINLPQLYKIFEQNQVQVLQKLITHYPLQSLREFFTRLTAKISFRIK